MVTSPSANVLELVGAQHHLRQRQPGGQGFLPAWQHVSAGNSGIDGLAAVIDQLAGVRIPASAIEPLVLAPRIRDYSPAMLDELLASGDVTWSGAGSISGSDGWIALHPADSAPMTLAEPAEIDFTDAHRAILASLGTGGAYFFRQLTHDGLTEAELKAALWELIWAGRVTGDTFAPVRAVLGGAGTRKRAAPAHGGHRPPRLSRYRLTPRPRPATLTRPSPGGGPRCRFPNRTPRCAPITKPSCC